MGHKGVAPFRGQRDAEELETLYREQYFTLVRLAWMLSRNRSEAEDVVQDVFIRYSQLATSPRNPVAYLKRMVVNRVHDNRKHDAVVQREVERRREPEVQLPTDETVLHVWRIVDGLDEPQRSTVIMRYYGDFSPADIARLLHCSEGTVHSRLSRALTKLREAGL